MSPTWTSLFLLVIPGEDVIPRRRVLKKVSRLSGVRRYAVVLSRMMLQDPNVVILDEPTNHLDLESIQAFNESMSNFKGIVLLNLA